MAKRKSKSQAKGAQQAAMSASKERNTKENPFEVRINKRRYEILGRKTKHERGKPGVSRSKGIKKREKTLLVEYKQRNKANTFIDKRFGEYDENLSLEEKMLKRFATEKQRHHEKAGLFNLEDEDLTHFGQSLGDIKQFDGPVLSDDEDVDQRNDYHFGGFLKRRGPNEGKNDGQPKSKKEIMEEVVANAKLRKHERQVVKEEAETMRQKLDDGLDSIRGLLNFRVDATESEPRPKADEYDKIVREMTFEMKAQASDKLKTEEQIARQEEEKLKKLEAERIRRMKGLPPQEKKPTHRSADDLDEGYTLDVDMRTLLTYEDGKMVMPDGYISDEESMKGDVGIRMEENGEEEDEDGSDEEDGNESEEENDDSDLESSGNDTDVEDQPTTNKSKEDVTANKSFTKLKSSKSSKIPKNDLPYTFNAPKTYEEFCELIDKRSSADMLKIVERIQKCNHPKLNPANKAKMEMFFAILLQYIDELLSRSPPDLSSVDELVGHLFTLAQHSPVFAAQSMQETLKTIQKQFCEMRKKRKIPNLKTVVYLRIVSLLFPTSDFRHAVCTPALIFMGQILSQMTVHSVRDALVGLFISSLTYEFVHTSKRYVPEVINFFTGILYLSSEKTEPLGKVFPPFKLHSKHKDILKISSNTVPSNDSEPVSVTVLFTTTAAEADKDDDTTRINALWTCLTLLRKFISLYAHLTSFPEIFEPVVHHMKRINISNYPLSIQSLHGDMLTTIASHVTERQPLTLQTRRPTPIQMFEPKFEEHYEIKRKHSSGNKTVNEGQKLRYKHKKEFKGAVREIRKDSQFLAKQQLQEQLERDAERARKTKEIKSFLSNQQAEANAFNKKKRKLRE